MTTENSNWKPSFNDKLTIGHDKHEYILITRNEYKDEEQLDNGDVNPYWVGNFYTVKNTKNEFRTWRNGNDVNSTLFIRNELKDPRVSPPKNQFFFSVVHFDIYKKSELRDKTGAVRTMKAGPNAGQPLKVWSTVTSLKDRKLLAKTPDEDTQFFRKKFLQVGPSHYNNLLLINDKARSLCFCGGHLDISAYKCGNCGELLISSETPNVTTADLNRFADSQKRCPHCRTMTEPEAVLECDTCFEPTPHAFDQVVAKVKKVGTGPQTTIQVDDVVSVAHFLLENKEHIIELDDEGKPITDDGQYIYTEELEKLINAVWDFDAANPPPSDGEVSSFLGLSPNEEGYSTAATSYSKPKADVNKRRFR